MVTNVLSPIGRNVAEQPAVAEGPQPVSLGRLAKSAAVTALAAAAADLTVYVVGGVWGVPGEYGPFFNPVMIAALVLIGVAVAAVGLAVLRRLSGRADTIFRIAAVA